MAKMPPILAYAHHEHKVVFEHKFPCRVLADGLFRVTIAEELQEDFQSFYKEYTDKYSEVRKEFAVKTHDEAVKICSKFAEWKVSATEEKQMVIFYSTENNQGQFWMGENGNIEPDGVDQSTGEWKSIGSKFVHSKRDCSAGINAYTAYIVKITARGGGIAYRYEYVPDEDLSEIGKRLKSYNLNCVPSFYRESNDKYVLYSDEAASFFVNQIEKTLRIAQDLTEFLDRDRVEIGEDFKNGKVPYNMEKL